MTKIKLIESGGFMGKTRSADEEFDITEADLKELVSTQKKTTNPKLRDGLNYTLVFNNKEVVVTPHELSGIAKKIVSKLLKNLKPET